MYASHHIIGLSPDDVVYCHLPMYHSSGGQVATCSSILFGTKTVIRRKFSASAFWKDCVGFNITVSTIIIITRSGGRSENRWGGRGASSNTWSFYGTGSPSNSAKIWGEDTHTPPSCPLGSACPDYNSSYSIPILRLLLLDHAVSHRIETILIRRYMLLQN